MMLDDVTGDERARPAGGRRRPAVVATAAAVLALLCGGLVAGCGDDGSDDRDGVGRQAQDLAESVGAVAVAESLRVSLAARDVGADVDRRNVDVLRRAADDVPGDPDISGIADEDGDGRDDDGKVEVRVEDQTACLTIAEDGDTDVSDRSC